MLDDPPLDVLLSLHPAPIQDVAQRLRAIVLRTVPDALEIVDGLQPVRRGQRLIGYRIPLDRRRRPYFAWILAEQVHAHLGFTYGALLADPDGVLEGREFRRVRFVTYRKPADIVDPARLEAFLLAAVEVASMPRGQRMARFVEAGGGLGPGV